MASTPRRRSTGGRQFLFDTARCFFYIANDGEKSAEEVVFDANGRCNQENLLQQLKSDVRSLTAPVDNLLSNWAYMVMGSLAWIPKAWAALLLPESGRSGPLPPSTALSATESDMKQAQPRTPFPTLTRSAARIVARPDRKTTSGNASSIRLFKD